MNNPVEYNFPDHYLGDGVTDIRITFKYRTGTFLDLVGCKIKMQLREFGKKLYYEFSTEAENPENKLIIRPNGTVEFPKLNAFGTRQTICEYDLQVTDQIGFVRTFIKGTWKINQDITK
jgi:hypothetical protein